MSSQENPTEDAPLRVDIDVLEEVCKRLLSMMREYPPVALYVDHYWSLSHESLFNIERVPWQGSRRDFTLGQLSDDWEGLQRIAQGKAPASDVGVQQLANVLNALVEARMAPENRPEGE